jgi:hypothetical protein
LRWLKQAAVLVLELRVPEVMRVVAHWVDIPPV